MNFIQPVRAIRAGARIIRAVERVIGAKARVIGAEAHVIRAEARVIRAEAWAMRANARTIGAYDYDAVIVGTTDLTHYGPSYRFTPHGVGAKGNGWAKNENDRRFIDLVCALKSREVVPEATEHRNACSSGATAATLAAVSALGATRGVLLDHTSSAEVQARRATANPTDSVGYAAVVFA